jgi:hypothetical protein
MTEITNPLPDDPSGPSATDEQSLPPDGAGSLLDAGSSGTDDGPGGIPAALAGEDRDGDAVPPPPAALPGDAVGSAGPGEEDDPLSPADTATPSQVSGGRSESAASDSLPQEHHGR